MFYMFFLKKKCKTSLKGLSQKVCRAYKTLFLMLIHHLRCKKNPKIQNIIVVIIGTVVILLDTTSKNI